MDHSLRSPRALVNPDFILAAQKLHQEGAIPANSYVIDLDAVEENARLTTVEARRLPISPFPTSSRRARKMSISSPEIDMPPMPTTNAPKPAVSPPGASLPMTGSRMGATSGPR